MRAVNRAPHQILSKISLFFAFGELAYFLWPWAMKESPGKTGIIPVT